MPVLARCLVKGGLLRCERPPFMLQYLVFCLPFCRLLQDAGFTPPFRLLHYSLLARQVALCFIYVAVFWQMCFRFYEKTKKAVFVLLFTLLGLSLQNLSCALPGSGEPASGPYVQSCNKTISARHFHAARIYDNNI